jgi:peptidoglycan-N-acetylglucosamine deacetylase
MFILYLIYFVFSAHASMEDFYPEERTYTNSTDHGLKPYISPSLYQTSQYALTFDDGPHITHTPKLLDVLKKHDVKATFFIVTERLNAQTLPVLKRILDEGHRVASHDHVHENNNQVAEAAFKTKVTKSIKTLYEYTQKAGYDLTEFFYRFPYGAYGKNSTYHHMNALRSLSRSLFGENCVQFAFWDIDSADWVNDMTSEDVFSTLKAHHEGGQAYTYKTTTLPNRQTYYAKVPFKVTTPLVGGVVLQHDIQSKTIKATDLFLEYAKEKKIQIIDLAQVEEYRVKDQCFFQK